MTVELGNWEHDREVLSNYPIFNLHNYAILWPYRLKARTWPSQGRNTGSKPVRATKHCRNVEMANWEIERYVRTNFAITRLHNAKRQFQVSGIASCAFDDCRRASRASALPLAFHSHDVRQSWLSPLGYSPLFDRDHIWSLSNPTAGARHRLIRRCSVLS